MTRLDDLPEHRRDALLWRYALELDYDGVDDLVQEQSERPCWWKFGCPPEETSELAAVLGDDGRYHLRGGGRVLCSSRGAHPAGEPHEQRCFWWTDGAHYRLQHPSDRPCDRGEHGARTVTWTVTLTGVTTDPTLVPHRQRCLQRGTRLRWPPHHTTATALGRIRAALITALGAACHACGREPGRFVDHDHFTGQVRGLLCIHCNTHVDYCPHATGCPWAEYLNTPPAAALRLTHPKASAAHLGHQTTIDYLGLDPFRYRQGTNRGRTR